MTRTEEKWYHRGKEARMSGKPRQFPDGRINPVNRQAFYAGWDEQSRLTTQRTPEQVASYNRFVDQLRAFTAEMRAAKNRKP